MLMGVYLFYEVRAAPAPVPVVTTGAHAAVEHAASRPAPIAPSRGVRPITHDRTPATAAPQGDVRMAPSLDGQRPTTPEIKLSETMDQANDAYNRQEYDEAMDIAQKVLAKEPNNVRMLRVMVASSCIAGDPAVGQKYFDLLPRFDRDQMNTRCARYGVTYKEPAQ